MKTELLAPAKNIKIAKLAIDCGADAVYIGSVSFGARQNASNSIEDIEELVKYAHKFYVKVYVTVNTIISDRELDDVKKIINKLYDIGVDALIVQDMAILKMSIDGVIAPIPLHISTQCDNRLDEKIKFFNDIGVPRVVLARELSIEKISELKTKYPNLEFETFIHGALCVSYSGQCYLSCYIGGRSANKGECAQPCRKKYSLIDDKGNVLISDKHLLSLKDFNASDSIKELIDAGVLSYKIEGRLKDELYVKNVVGYYRQLFDKYAEKTSSGIVNLTFKPDLYKSFNRGYTDYFLHSRKKCFNFDSPKSLGERLGKISKVGKNWFEISKDKHLNYTLNPQDGLYFNETGCLINKVEGDKIYPNKMNGIAVGVEVFRNFDSKFEKQLENSKTKRKISVKFSFENSCLKAIDEDGNYVQIAIPTTEQAKNPDKMKSNFITQLQKTGESDFYCENVEILNELPFLPISEINELRRNILDKLMDERLKNYKREIQKPLHQVEFPKKELDYRANIHNSQAKCFYENAGCKVCEMSLETNLQKARPIELMHTKHCLKFALDMCKSPKKLFLIDEKGKKYPLKFDCKNCEMYVLAD